jgi:hypothetical protein
VGPTFNLHTLFLDKYSFLGLICDRLVKTYEHKVCGMGSDIIRTKQAFGIIGWREWVCFPELDGLRTKAKIDTGAQTSAIHAWNITPYEKDGEKWVSFELHPVQNSKKNSTKCSARLHDVKDIRSSNGITESRYTIVTEAKIGLHHFPIELTLTNRDAMGYRMLLGRSALHNRFLVDCSHSYIYGSK